MVEGRKRESNYVDTPVVFLTDDLPKPTFEEEAATSKDNDKLFRLCQVCTTDELQPCMILSTKWEVHCKGRAHQSNLRNRSGVQRKVAMTGPEVEAKRKERQQRREMNRKVEELV